MERAVGGGAELVVTGYALRWLPRGTELRNEVIQVHRPLVHFLYLAATRPLMTDGDREDRVDINKADRVPAFGQMLVVERPAHVHHEPSVFPEAIAAHIAIRLRAWLEVAAILRDGLGQVFLCPGPPCTMPTLYRAWIAGT